MKVTKNVYVEILKVKEIGIQSKHLMPSLVYTIIINAFYDFSINLFII